MGEFELIRRFLAQIGVPSDDLALGIGDDCALITPPAGFQLCCSLDAMVEGVHFPQHYSPVYLAQRALSAALSDLAAMGARASHYTLSLTLPEPDPEWLEGFAKGLAAVSERYAICLVGGDTTRGPLALAVQVHGWVPHGRAIKRSGAKPGDVVLVSGSLGAARAALELLATSDPSAAQAALLGRYHQPRPRLALGQKLMPFAHAAIDISDGLMADAGHIAQASACELVLDARKIPMDEALKHLFPRAALGFALHGGDDYELLVTMPGQAWSEVQDQDWSAQLTAIGEVRAGQGVRLQHAPNTNYQEQAGYQHFV